MKGLRFFWIDLAVILTFLVGATVTVDGINCPLTDARAIAYLCSSLVVVALGIVDYQPYQVGLMTSDKFVAIYTGTVITEAHAEYQIALDKFDG